MQPAVRPPDRGPNMKVLADGRGAPGLNGKKWGSRAAGATRVRECFVQDLPLEMVAEILTELTSVNLVVMQEALSKPVRIYLRNTSLDSALESICRTNGLWYRTSDGIMSIMTEEAYSSSMVFRRSEKVQAYFMRYTNAADMASLISTLLGPSVKYQPMPSQSVYGHIEASGKGGASGGKGGASSQKESDLTKEERKQLLQQGAATGVQDVVEASQVLGKRLPAVITVFRKNNCMVVKSADGELLQEIYHIVGALDTPTQQVLLDVKILNIKLGDDFESFFNFAYEDPGSGLSFGTLGGTTPDADTLAFVFTNEYITARVALYAEDNRVEMKSAPFLMTADNVAVKFFSGKETPLREDVTTKTLPIGDLGETLTTYEVEISREELGTELNISSFINADQTVTLSISAKISTANLGVSEITLINDKTGQSVVFPLDGVDKSEFNSVVVVPSNHTVALGGLIASEDRDFQQKVPILGDIPLVGLVFKRTEKVKERTETVVLLTPHVIGNPYDSGPASSEFLDKETILNRVEEESEKMRGSTSNPFKGWDLSCPNPPRSPLSESEPAEE